MVGDAEELPFDDDQFDVYTIAFGIRNVTHIEQVSDPVITDLGGKTCTRSNCWFDDSTY